MTQLAYFPVVEDEDQLIDILSRGSWFLTFSPIKRIFVFVADPKLAETTWEVAPGMDPAVAERFDTLRALIEFVPASSVADVAPVMEQVSMVLCWKKGVHPEWLPRATLTKWLSDKQVFEVDPEAVRYEGSRYIDVGFLLLENRVDVVRENHIRFKALTEELGSRDRAYVLATGPSVGAYSRFDYEGAIRIVCNSVILNGELMRTVRPHFLVFADPIFHFGPSQYAASFRDAVRMAAHEHEFTICIPLKYYAVFAAAMPEMMNRTVAIPFRKDRLWNFDLAADFELKTTANVLTLMMLPLATTLAKEVRILGCDGRPLTEDTYFWKHNQATQIGDKLANVREAHPAFFNIDYNDYYLEHCQILEDQLKAGEKLGKRFECLAASHIPALRDRVAQGGREKAADRVRPTVAVIDPDALNWVGHFMGYNDRLVSALEEQGYPVKVICNEKLDPEILRQRPNFLPRLSVHSWEIGGALTNQPAVTRCEAELARAVGEVLDDGPLIVYMYTGTVDHALMLARLIANEPRLQGEVNLFWAAFHHHQWEEWIGRHRSNLHELGRASPRLRVTVPTSSLQRAISEATGEVFEVPPLPSTSVADEEFAFGEHDASPADLNLTSCNGRSDPMRVLFPGNPRTGKGFDVTLAAVERLGTEDLLRPVIRYYPQPGGGKALASREGGGMEVDAHEARIQRLRPRAEVVEGELDRRAFLNLFRTSHLSVLPYEPAAFATRTSGLLIDSIYHGLPVVACRGTWLGEIVGRYRCGVVVEQNSPDELVAAVHEVVDNYPTMAANARSAARSYFADNSWQSLAQSITATRSRQALDEQRDGTETDASFPRLLVIDPTRVGEPAATGQIKKNLLNDWPDRAFLQICAPDRNRYRVAQSVDDSSTDLHLEEEAVYQEIVAFDPEVIYVRPAIDLRYPPSSDLYALASKVVARHSAPLVTHMMDDWPNRLARRDEARAREVDDSLRRLLSRSHKVLSISDKMSAILGERYQVTCEVVANGIDPDTYRRVSAAARSEKMQRNEVVVRYFGAVAEDMTFHTLVDVARAVDGLHGELPLRLEVYTKRARWISEEWPLTEWHSGTRLRGNWRVAFEEAVAGLRGVSVFDSVPDEAYPSGLAEADILLLGYNFDEDSLGYIHSSMPNKLPEYLASGAAVLAVGPREAHGIDYLLSRQLGCCVTERDGSKLAEALRRLAIDASYRDELANRAQAWALEQLDIGSISKRFEGILRGAAAQRGKPPLLGPFPRTRRAKVDEHTVIARLLSDLGSDQVLIDVGAHHGSALAPFAEAGWKVVACEPDPLNRAALVQRVGDKANVAIDSRAISNEPDQGTPFYSSDESTGISGLYAFHESHKEADPVDVTTVAALADAYDLSHITFLKIDAEGCDFNVLKGVPWSRITPDVIECEFEDGKTASLGHTHHDIAAYLVERGYSLYVSEWHPVIRYGIPHDWCQLVQYPAPLGSADSWGNILAFREDPGAEVVKAAFTGCLDVESPPAPDATNGHPASTSGEAERDGRGVATSLPSVKRATEKRETLLAERQAADGPPLGTVFVLGNGPSLRGVDLEAFSGVATVGMNAAYRYWERVGWYPTHYCCLDEEVIGSHHDAIHSLVSEGRVRTAFLTARILDFHPELAEDDRCLFLDAFHKPWYERRGLKWGLRFAEHPAFQSSAPSKLTTGAYAVRYAIFLGYRKVYLLGIDCDYVEMVDGARAAGDLALEMTRTPESNPNYFFDDYQQTGDRYNIPNPEVHGANLHLQALAVLRDDVAEQELPVEIRNCSKTSRLASEGLFPFEELDQALGRHPSWLARAMRRTRRTRNKEDSVVPTRTSLYERSYAFAKARSPLIFSAGRLAMWCARKVRRYPGWAAAYLALLAGLTALGSWPGVEPYGPLFWVLAGLLVFAGAVVVTTGYARFLIKHTERESRRRDDRIRFQQDRTQEGLEAKIDELRSAQEAMQDALGVSFAAHQKRTKEVFEAEIGELKSELATAQERELSLDIVSALRQVGPLWLGRPGVRGLDMSKEHEHGHAVLMAVLVEEALKQPEILIGKTLIEVGSTRERDPRQGSTEKLAVFTAMMHMRFISVDMDPLSTSRASRVVEYLNPEAKAVNEKGETYLAAASEPLDYVYLDAFDFDHGEHSAERQARYREVLNTEIRDEACWQMHALCAAALITKMPTGGVVVIDDTWVDDAGEFDGKGKLAVPLLLAAGFEVITKAPRTVALKRATGGSPATPHTQ